MSNSDTIARQRTNLRFVCRFLYIACLLLTAMALVPLLTWFAAIGYALIVLAAIHFRKMARGSFYDSHLRNTFHLAAGAYFLVLFESLIILRMNLAFTVPLCVATLIWMMYRLALGLKRLDGQRRV